MELSLQLQLGEVAEDRLESLGSQEPHAHCPLTQHRHTPTSLGSGPPSGPSGVTEWGKPEWGKIQIG